MIFEPPALPEPLTDIDDDGNQVVFRTTWDAIGRAAVEIEYGYLRHGNRRRVIWQRFSVCHWCCWRPMRLGRVDYQPTNVRFGWTRAISRFVACRHCGHIEGVIL